MICKGRLWKRAFLSIGSPMGSLDRGWTELAPESTYVKRLPKFATKNYYISGHLSVLCVAQKNSAPTKLLKRILDLLINAKVPSTVRLGHF
jgi:hypothetical protein